MAAGVGLDRVLPQDSGQLLYPLSLLVDDDELLFIKAPAGEERKLLKNKPASTIANYRWYCRLSRWGSILSVHSWITCTLLCTSRICILLWVILLTCVCNLVSFSIPAVYAICGNPIPHFHTMPPFYLPSFLHSSI